MIDFCWRRIRPIHGTNPNFPMASAFQWLNRGRDALAPEDYSLKIGRSAPERGHNEPKVRALGRRAAPWLACWVVTCCLALNGCASKTPQAANEPSSYPPWVCGLSHNKDRWQCQREGEEPSAGEREEEPLAGEELSAGEREGEPLADGQPAPSAAPSAEARKPTPAKTPRPIQPAAQRRRRPNPSPPRHRLNRPRTKTMTHPLRRRMTLPSRPIRPPHQPSKCLHQQRRNSPSPLVGLTKRAT